MNDSLTKSVKIVLSKSICFCQKLTEFKKKSLENINLGEHFLLKSLFSSVNFRTTLLLKPCPIMMMVLSLKSFRTHLLWNSTTDLTLVGNQCSQNAKLNYFGSQVYFHFSQKSAINCKMHRNYFCATFFINFCIMNLLFFLLKAE